MHSLRKVASDTVIMKVKNSVKADKSKGDQIVRRRGRVYVINKRNPRRKRRQG